VTAQARRAAKSSWSWQPLGGWRHRGNSPARDKVSGSSRRSARPSSSYLAQVARTVDLDHVAAGRSMLGVPPGFAQQQVPAPSTFALMAMIHSSLRQWLLPFGSGRRISAASLLRSSGHARADRLTQPGDQGHLRVGCWPAGGDDLRQGRCRSSAASSKVAGSAQESQKSSGAGAEAAGSGPSMLSVINIKQEGHSRQRQAQVGSIASPSAATEQTPGQAVSGRHPVGRCG